MGWKESEMVKEQRVQKKNEKSKKMGVRVKVRGIKKEQEE